MLLFGYFLPLFVYVDYIFVDDRVVTVMENELGKPRITQGAYSPLYTATVTFHCSLFRVHLVCHKQDFIMLCSLGILLTGSHF